MSEQLTILIPVYNREQYIRDAIKSILEQTHQNFVIQVYDDGSTDKSVELVKSFNDDRIKITIGKENRGVAFARNQLLYLCETKYAAWQDSDDVSNIHRIKYQLNATFEFSNENYRFGRNRGTKDNKLIFSRFKPLVNTTNYHEIPEFYTETGVNASAMFLVDKDIVFNEELKVGEDADWLRRMISKYGAKTLDYVLYYIRFHKDRLGVQCRK